MARRASSRRVVELTRDSRCAVLIVHDLSDVLLYFTKVVHYLDKYSKLNSKLLNATTQVSFFSFAVLFFWSRNW